MSDSTARNSNEKPALTAEELYEAVAHTIDDQEIRKILLVFAYTIAEMHVENDADIEIFCSMLRGVHKTVSTASAETANIH